MINAHVIVCLQTESLREKKSKASLLQLCRQLEDRSNMPVAATIGLQSQVLHFTMLDGATNITMHSRMSFSELCRV